MQFEDKETNKTHITEFIVYLVLGIIATLLHIIKMKIAAGKHYR